MGYPYVALPPETQEARLEFTLAFPSLVLAIRVAGYLHEFGLPAGVMEGSPNLVAGSCLSGQIAHVNFALYLAEEWSRA